MKKPLKVKDAIVDWKVDSHKSSLELIKKYKSDISPLTSKEKLNADLDYEVDQLFELAVDEEFQDGFESIFSRYLISFIEELGNKAIAALAPIFINEQVNAEIIAEALRWIGRIEHFSTYSGRLQLLEQCLFCSSHYIRDGATLGIASMNDPCTIPSLKLAISKEIISELRKDMKEVLVQLENNRNGIDSKNN